jgi:hypothetical protein
VNDVAAEDGVDGFFAMVRELERIRELGPRAPSRGGGGLSLVRRGAEEEGKPVPPLPPEGEGGGPIGKGER